MKVNDFNSKVNLPKLCASLKYNDYQFIKLPTFGWFAYNRDKTFVGNVFDVVGPDAAGTIYRHIIKDRPGWLDFNIPFSEVSDQRLRANYVTFASYHACYAMSKMEADKYVVKLNGRRAPLKEVLVENGLPHLLSSGIGVVTPLLRERWAALQWPKNAVGKLLVPTFCTPRHVCSLDLVNIETFERSATLWVNDERGWVGKLGNYIAKDLKEIGTTGGSTWDYKCDYWTDKVMNISDLLSVEDYLKVWTQSKNTIFSRSPLQLVKESGHVDEVRNYISGLSYKQITELEDATGEKLTGYWKNAREHEVNLGGHTFVKRDNCYYIRRGAGLLQVSNFTLDLESIVKVGRDFVRKGHIYFRDKIVPCEIEGKFFDSHYKFKQGINRKFLDYGLGVPIISPQFEHMILQIINSFNEGVEVTT